MALENKLGLTSSADLAREEERISKKKALALFENGVLDTLPAAKFSITASRCRNMTWSSCGLPLAPCSRIIKTLPCPSTRM